jgi:Na+-translocating ferredoxin:NAD+ oxidoreductase RnfD subunit
MPLSRLSPKQNELRGKGTMNAAVQLRRFVRTPKGLMIVILAIIGMLAALTEGVWLVLPGIAAAVASASAIDAIILRLRSGHWEFPDGAVLTGLFVAMILSSHESWQVAAITASIAIVSKYVFRSRFANLFNPAALALVISFYAFHTEQSWWGATPEPFPLAMAALFVSGFYIIDRINKMPLVLSFLGIYYLLFTTTAYLGQPRMVMEIFREPDLHASLFFAFFILTDPPTSPVRYTDQIACGIIVAVASYAIFEILGAAHYLLSGVLAGNIYEALRREFRTANRVSPLEAKEISNNL